MSGNLWTMEEDDLVLKYYSDGGFISLKEKGLNRSRDAVVHRAKILGVSVKRRANGWSEDELAILKKYYSDGGPKLVISKGVNRSNAVIRKKAQMLGLVVSKDKIGSKKWSELELELLKKYYPIGGSELCKEKGLTKTLNAIKNKAIREGIYKKEIKNHWSELEVALLKEYYPIGGYKLCQEMGLERPKEGIKSKAATEGLSFCDYCNKARHLWEDWELDILHKYYSKGGYKLCQEKGILRSESSIQNKANQQGLTKRIGYGNWSEDEEILIEHLYSKVGKKGVKISGVNRSYTSIMSKRYFMGLYVSKERLSYVKKHSKMWSDEEDAMLRWYYPSKGVNIDILDRSKCAIYMRAKSLGLKIDIDSFEYETNRWSFTEELILKDYYSEGGAKLCQEKGICRTTKAIRAKANSLGLRVSKEKRGIVLQSYRSGTFKWDDNALNIIKMYYPSGGYALCQEKGLDIPKRKIIAKANYLGIKRLK